jgi:hypothetical protein
VNNQIDSGAGSFSDSSHPYSSFISAERRPLLDIGLPQSSPRRSVLRCPHPADSRDLHQIIGPPCGGSTNAASPGTRSPFEDLSAPTSVSPPRNMPCPLSLEACDSSGYVSHIRHNGKNNWKKNIIVCSAIPPIDIFIKIEEIKYSQQANAIERQYLALNKHCECILRKHSKGTSKARL